MKQMCIIRCVDYYGVPNINKDEGVVEASGIQCYCSAHNTVYAVQDTSSHMIRPHAKSTVVLQSRNGERVIFCDR